MINFLISLEHFQLPFLAPNLWILKLIDLLLPENKLAKAVYTFLYEQVTFLVFTQYMEHHDIRSDFNLMLTNLKISTLSIVYIGELNTFILWQRGWKEIVDFISEADKFERDTHVSIKGKIINTFTKYFRGLTYFHWVLVFTTFITITHTTLFRFLPSANYCDEFGNGSELSLHILSSRMPFLNYYFSGNWMTENWHFFMCTCGAMIMTAYNTNFVALMIFLGEKLQLLREIRKQMLGRCYSGVRYDHAAKITHQLRQVHVLLTKYSRLFILLLLAFMFAYDTMYSLKLCASSFQLTVFNGAYSYYTLLYNEQIL